MKAQALANVESAFKDQEDRRGTYDSCVHQDNDLQHSCEPPLPSSPLPTPPHPSPSLLSCVHLCCVVDLNFSLANPSLSGAQEHPQPAMFHGQLKAYQLKGMNWLANLYNQVRMCGRGKVGRGCCGVVMLVPLC